jgi:hypothetical protein
MTIAPAGLPATAPAETTTTATTTPGAPGAPGAAGAGAKAAVASAASAATAASAQGTSIDFSLGVPFARVGSGTTGIDPLITFTLLETGQRVGAALGQTALGLRQAMATLVGAYSANVSIRAGLSQENADLQSDITRLNNDLTNPDAPDDPDNKALKDARAQLQTDIANHADQATLDADMRAVEKAEDVIKGKIANLTAQQTANGARIGVEENVALTGFANSFSNALGKIAAARLDTAAFDQALTAQLASITTDLKQFLAHVRKREKNRSDAQHDADDATIAALGDDALVQARHQADARQFGVLTADELVRNHQATGDPLPKDEHPGEQPGGPAAGTMADDAVSAAQQGQANISAADITVADLVAANAAAPAPPPADNVAAGVGGDARRAAVPPVNGSNANTAIARNAARAERREFAALEQTAKALVADIDRVLQTLEHAAAGAGISVASLQQNMAVDPDARVKLWV